MRVITNLSIQKGVDPLLAVAISKCESGLNVHAVNKTKNKDRTIDYGAMQINSIHIQTALDMGLDVVNEPIDNILFGLHLIKKNGTRDYYASRSCIEKTYGLGVG